MIGLDLLPSAFLNQKVEEGPLHLRPVYAAVRDHGCRLAVILQNKAAFELASGEGPLIAWIGDDTHQALGPNGFHKPSLRRVIQAATAASVISSGPEPQAYAAPCTNAVLRRENVLIVETRPEFEIPWVQFLQRAQPKLKVLICSPKGGTA